MPSPDKVSCIRKTFSSSFQFDENIVIKHDEKLKKNLNNKKEEISKPKKLNSTNEVKSFDKELKEDPFFFQ
tara:strand:- start:3871 stop:4083 length:213 start_codon:yes stop_codon:yes gene_type:complete